MSALAEQIARGHSRVTAAGVCLCGAEGIGFEVGYAEHIATVTERAVRERMMGERHCKTCVCGCTCGFGGEHVEGNPRCALTTEESDHSPSPEAVETFRAAWYEAEEDVRRSMLLLGEALDRLVKEVGS